MEELSRETHFPIKRTCLLISFLNYFIIILLKVIFIILLKIFSTKTQHKNMLCN